MGSLNRNSLIIGLVVGLVLGLLLGMLLFWVVFPVEWTDAQSYHLSPDNRATYMILVAVSYELNRDTQAAADYLAGWTAEEKQQAAAGAIARLEDEGNTQAAQAVRDLALVLGFESEAPPTPEEGPGLWERIRVPCLVFFVVLLVLVLGWIGLRVAMRQRQATVPQAPPVTAPPPDMARDVPTEATMAAPVVAPMPGAPVAEEWEGVGQPPLGHFFTTYQLGEDTYDESFSIETPMGEFLGECGVGISETIGVGAPDKVTAFEVWLFDKSDIRTVTNVLMSSHAFNDDALRAKLAPKGEAILAQPGAPFTLETTGLQVRAEITEIDYGEEEEAPANSFFSKLTIELVAMSKPPEETASQF
jgi:hypothetical protein